MKLSIAPGIKHINLVYPLTFPNELLSIQVIGEDIAWTEMLLLAIAYLK